MEWTVFDSRRGQFKLVKADGQREAVRKGFELGVVARHTNDVRPRTSDAVLMSISEFRGFMERVLPDVDID